MAAWQIGSAFLPKQTRDKFLPHRKTFVLAELGKQDLPRRFDGGTCRCWYCREHIDKHASIVSVPARASLDVRVPILAADVGGAAAWKVDASDGSGYDVGITVTFTPAASDAAGGDGDRDGDGDGSGGGAGGSGGGASDVRGKAIAELGVCKDGSGTWTVSGVGSLVITLNNEHAWVRSKSVAWSVAICAGSTRAHTAQQQQQQHMHSQSD
jgi:hypothetical protein